MRISAIIAMSDNRVIGNAGRLPWHLPADLKRFKEITMGKPILMGRKTHQSIGHVLPGRCNVVITHDAEFKANGCVIAHSIDTALDAVSYSDEIFIIGGALIFQQLLSRIQRIYLTIIHHEFEGDTFLPVFNMHEWQEVTREDHLPDEINQYEYSFIVLERK